MYGKQSPCRVCSPGWRVGVAQAWAQQSQLLREGWLPQSLAHLCLQTNMGKIMPLQASVI